MPDGESARKADAKMRNRPSTLFKINNSRVTLQLHVATPGRLLGRTVAFDCDDACRHPLSLASASPTGAHKWRKRRMLCRNSLLTFSMASIG